MGKLPIRLLATGQFLGAQEGVHSLLLPLAYSSSDSRNTWMDQLARARSLGGYAKRTASPVVTDTTTVGGRFVHFYHYTVLNASTGAVTRIELGLLASSATEYELWKSLDGGVTWTFLFDYGTGLTAYRPDFAQLGNALVIAVPTKMSKSYDGTTLADVTTTRLAAPTVVVGAAGTLSGAYKYWIVPLNTDGTRKSASVASAITLLDKQQNTVNWTADADGGVIGYEVYRTFGEGTLGFFMGAVSGRLTVTITDDVDDQTLVTGRALTEYGEAPPTGIFFAEMHKLRMWYGRTLANPRRWYFSDPGLPYSLHLDSHFVDCSDSESMSDVSTGATGGFTRQGLFGGDDMIVLWLERSVWTVSGTGRVQSAVLATAAVGNVIDWDLKRSNARTGSVSQRAVARVPKGAVYTDHFGQPQTIGYVALAFLTPLGDVRIFDGLDDFVISSGMQATFQRIAYNARGQAHQLTDTDRSEITWFIPIGSSASSDSAFLAITWNYKYGTWHERDWSFAATLSMETDTEANTLIASEAEISVGGYVYTLWSGLTFNSEAVNAALTTKTLYGSLLPFDKFDMPALIAMEKRWRWVQILLTLSTDLTLFAEWWGTSGEDMDLEPRLASRTIATSAALPALPAASYAATVLTDTPVHHWRLGEASGDALDAGSGNDFLSGSGGLTYAQAGAIRNDSDTAVLFNGTTGKFSGGIDAMTAVANFTLEAWIKGNGVSWLGTQTIVYVKPGTKKHPLMYLTVGGYATLHIPVNNTTMSFSSRTPISPSGWHHLVLTWTSGSRVAFYIDGVLDCVTRASVVDCTGTVTVDAAAAAHIGVDSTGAANFFAGTIDEVAIYTTLITEADIVAHYQYGVRERTIVLRVPLKDSDGRYLHSRGMRLRLSSSTLTAEWKVAGLSFGYQILPGLKRPFRR